MEKQYKRLLFLMVIFVPMAIHAEVPNLYRGEAYQKGHKVCVFGDSGHGNSDQLLVASALEKEGCNEIRHTGDIVYPSGIKNTSDKLLQARFITPYKNLFPTIPFYLVVGNHDYAGNESAWIDVSKKYPQIKFPSLHYADIHGDVCFVNFDTDGVKTYAAQGRYLEAVKSEIGSSCRLSVAVGHHPYLSAGQHGDATAGVKEFVEENILGHFDIYMSGHDHNLSDEGEVSGTRFFVSGAGGELRKLDHKGRVWALSNLGYLTLTYQNEAQIPSFDFNFIAVGKDGARQVVHSGKVMGKGLR